MIKSMNVAWWVERWADLHPNKVAVYWDESSITYKELMGKMDQVCCLLQSLGLEKGDRLCVMMKNSLEFLLLFLACAKLGVIFVPINFRLTGPEVQYILGNARPRVFVFEKEYWDIIGPLGLEIHRPPISLLVVDGPAPSHVLSFSQELEAFANKRPFLTKSLAPADPEEPHVIMYTSGTTGHPKGAVLSHRKTFFNCLNADIFFKMHFDDVMLIVLPMFHSGGLFIQAAPTLYKGATMVIHRRFDPHMVYRDIQRYRVTKFLGVPTVYRALLRIPPDERGDISSLKVCAIGGEKTSHELIVRCMEAGFRLRQVMGQTETSILLWASEEDMLKKPGTVGRPVFHAEVELFDRHGRPVAPGSVGEIVVRGSIMMKEYWQDPERTESTIVNGWLHTGDLAYQDQEGYFYLVDRAKDMYISGGENVYPKEVELVLSQHPDVEDVAVVGVPDETWGEVGHAFVVPRPNTNPTQEEIIAFCQGRLAAFKWPKKVTFVSSLPRTSLGKVQKYLLIGRSEDHGFFNNLIKEKEVSVDPLQILRELGVGFVASSKDYNEHLETLVLVHGAGGNSSVWLHQIEGLKSRLNVIAIDLVGHGNSKAEPRRSILEMAQWLGNTLTKCFKNKVIVAGHSMGGAVALELALQFPGLVKTLILLATGPELKVAPQFLDGLKGDFENTVRKIMKYAYAPSVDKATVDQGIALMLSSGQDTVYWDFYSCNEFNVRDRLKEIQVPCLILAGDQDRLTPISLSFALLEGLVEARLVKISGAGHMLMMERPERVNQEILSFIHGR